MLQTGQATPSSLTHVKQAGISNMPGRRPKHARETAKLKLNGVNQVCLYLCLYLSIYLSIYLFIYLCNIYVTIYLSILCTSNMLQAGQATPSSLTHVKQAGISNMPGRRQNMPGRRQS